MPSMPIDRRTLLAGIAGAALPVSAFGLEASQFGVRPGTADDQTRSLQRPIDEAARRRAPLALAPGIYRTSGLELPSGAQIAGVRGATRLLLTGTASLFASEHAETLTLSGLILEGGDRRLPQNRALCIARTSRRCASPTVRSRARAATA